MPKSTLTQLEVRSRLTTFKRLTKLVAMLASQSRIIATLEKLYGDEVMNNRTFQEYKRVAEAFERDTKDNLVTTLFYSRVITF